MSKKTPARPRTVATPFARLTPDHPHHLFQVNPGVDASQALEEASLMLSAAYDMAGEIAQLEDFSDAVWGMVTLIQMAKAVVDSVSAGVCRPPEEA